MIVQILERLEGPTVSPPEPVDRLRIVPHNSDPLCLVLHGVHDAHLQRNDTAAFSVGNEASVLNVR